MADEKRLITVATLVYALQAAGFLLPPLVWIVAVIVDYVKKDDAAGTWLESHFRWQIRSFWWGLLWGVIGGILLLVLIGYLVLAANAVWIIYRIVKGWLRLSERREVS
ncbi:MAG TPA: hypothetical protein VGJ74_20500 [Burkholderiales bacterium]